MSHFEIVGALALANPYIYHSQWPLSGSSHKEWYHSRYPRSYDPPGH